MLRGAVTSSSLNQRMPSVKIAMPDYELRTYQRRPNKIMPRDQLLTVNKNDSKSELLNDLVLAKTIFTVHKTSACFRTMRK